MPLGHGVHSGTAVGTHRFEHVPEHSTGEVAHTSEVSTAHGRGPSGSTPSPEPGMSVSMRPASRGVSMEVHKHRHALSVSHSGTVAKLAGSYFRSCLRPRPTRRVRRGRVRIRLRFLFFKVELLLESIPISLAHSSPDPMPGIQIKREL